MKYSGKRVALARSHGLKTTARGGEFAMPRTNVRTAVELLKVDRIDHGYTVVDAPEFVRRCAHAGSVFTMAPTNSYYLCSLPRDRWALHHPIRRMPGVGAMRSFMHHGVRAAWLDEVTRRHWARAFDAGFDTALAMGRAAAPSNL